MKTLLAIVFVTLFAVSAAAQDAAPASSDLDPLVQRIRERITRYYTELQSFAWTVKAHREFLKKDRTPKEKPQDLVSDSIIRLQPPTPPDTRAPFYIREETVPRLVDGKPLKKGEKPKDTYPVVAGMSLPGVFLVTDPRKDGYSFSNAGTGELNGRKVLLLDVDSAQKMPRRVDVNKNLFGIPAGFQIIGIQYNKGRLWIDAETYDVLRLDWRSDPFEFEERGEKFRHEVSMSARFRPMRLEGADRSVLVPEFFEAIQVLDGGQHPFIRTTFSFEDFKRFSGEIKITPLEALPK